MAEIISNLNPLFIAIAGGVVPSVVWLWFWLREDRATPEPTGLIALSFFAGMTVVFLVLPPEQFVSSSISSLGDWIRSFGSTTDISQLSNDTIKITLWAFIEEVAKYATVFLIAFRTKYFDEPIDAVIYLITAALGFAAMENTLYIFNILGQGGGIQALHDGAMRFVGATILHTVSSAVVGITIAFSFFAPRLIKFVAAILGITLASLLHAYFNLSIMKSDGTLNTILVFSQYWAGIVGVIVLLQIVKRLKAN